MPADELNNACTASGLGSYDPETAVQYANWDAELGMCRVGIQCSEGTTERLLPGDAVETERTTYREARANCLSHRGVTPPWEEPWPSPETGTIKERGGWAWDDAQEQVRGCVINKTTSPILVTYSKPTPPVFGRPDPAGYKQQPYMLPANMDDDDCPPIDVDFVRACDGLWYKVPPVTDVEVSIENGTCKVQGAVCSKSRGPWPYAWECEDP